MKDIEQARMLLSIARKEVVALQGMTEDRKETIQRLTELMERVGVLNIKMD